MCTNKVDLDMEIVLDPRFAQGFGSGLPLRFLCCCGIDAVLLSERMGDTRQMMARLSQSSTVASVYINLGTNRKDASRAGEWAA